MNIGIPRNIGLQPLTRSAFKLLGPSQRTEAYENINNTYSLENCKNKCKNYHFITTFKVHRTGDTYKTAKKLISSTRISLVK